MPIFSIILPTYNRAKLLNRAVQNVVEQSFQDWELIVIDDGSTDNSKDVIASFSDPRIRYFYHHNKGRSISRNIGITHAAGDWVCFIDSDDYYKPNHLEVFYSHIQSGIKSSIYKTGIEFINETEKVIFQSSFLSQGENVIQFFSLKYCSILDLCISKSLTKSNKFENVSTWEDKAFILDLLQTNEIHQINERTVMAYEHKDRSILKIHQNPSEINKVLQLMVLKLKKHNASNQLINQVQQNFILSLLIDARQQKSKKSVESLLSQIQVKPSWKTKLRLLKARLIN